MEKTLKIENGLVRIDSNTITMGEGANLTIMANKQKMSKDYTYEELEISMTQRTDGCCTSSLKIWNPTQEDIEELGNALLEIAKNFRKEK